MPADVAWFDHLLHPATRISLPVFNCTNVPPQWRIGTRTLDEHLIYLLLDGGMYARFEGAEYHCEAGDVFWLPPGCTHDFRFDHRQHLHLYHCRFRLNPAPAVEPAPLLVRRSQGLEAGWARLLSDWQMDLPLASHTTRALLATALVELVRHSQAEQGGGFSEARRAAIQRWLLATPPADWHPRGLARALGLSLDHCSRVFSTTYGCRPRTWLMRERIKRSTADLAETNASVAAIAEAWGWSDPFLYSRQFKQVLGHSPSAWRASH